MASLASYNDGFSRIQLYLVTLVSILVILLTLSIFHSIFLSPYCHIPGPLLCKLNKWWITFHDLRRQRPQKIAEWHAKYGPIVLIAPGEVSIAEPTAMREIYSSSGRHEKSYYFDNFITHNERSIFAEKGYQSHRQKRRLTSSFYQATSVLKPTIEAPMRGRVSAVLEQLQLRLGLGSGSVDIFPLVNHYAWDNITRLVYGPRHCSQSVEQDCYERTLLVGLKQTEWWNTLRNNFPLAHRLFQFCGALATGSKDFLTAEYDLSTWSHQKLKTAAKDTEVSVDHSLLRRLGELKTAEGLPLSSNYIECEVLDNLHAAQATVTVALAYVIYHLSKHPEWQEKVRQELSSLPKESDGFPSFSSIDAAPIFNACVREAYRLNPGSSGRAERVIPVGKQYADVFIPANSIASASTIALHNLPNLFPSPKTFDPRRWLDASPEQLRVQETGFIPFGYGARVCLGKAYATLEIKLLTAAILLEYTTHIDEAAGTENNMRQAGTQDALPRGLRCDIGFRKLQ
ncbi:uncharacterized protein K452DRAFT_228746 [Aplosporella prunicola CBS 121167]|uniref:Cytochrome P450 n=1 Tax=Aplosporella prunicola CBS 121167 TaxID=1176127 RepID=A0A6A6BAP7_9PEZI|nr:uncharacterized protein K452DRAFT_228746 [Aplosporella prunicola CBS 121167]KAF2141289.1 hypothetical protein K452DRAFT_228746 [Aplosporella prunicola CBS 121167]